MSSRSLRVLIVDDEESDALLFGSFLEKIPETVVEVEWAPSFRDGLQRLQNGPHDVCLLDYQMEGGTGVDLLRKARAFAIRTPIILLTGKGSRDVDLEAMRSGAMDYLVKSEVQPDTLERAVRYAVERHRAQEELRRSEERHRGMFDHLPLGLFRVGPDGEYLEANPALIRILQYPDRHALHEVWASNFFVSPRDRKRFRSALEDQGSVSGFETTVSTGGERTIRLRVTARVHRGPGGRAEYVEGSVEDLTGVRSASEIEEEATGFRTLAHVTRTGVARADPDGHIQWLNPALAEFLGDDARAAEGRGIWTLFHPADQDRLAAALEEVAAGTRDRAVRNARLVSTDGDEATRRVVVAALTGRGRSLQGILLVLDTPEPGVERLDP